MRCGTFFDIPKHWRMNCIYLWAALCFCSVSYTELLSAPERLADLCSADGSLSQSTMHETSCSADGSAELADCLGCAGFSPLAATNWFRLRFRPRDDSRPLVHAREPRAQQEIDRARQEMKRKSTRKSPGPTHLRDKRSSRSNIEDFRLSSLQRRGVFGLYQ